jgi:hypothetical protein
MKKLLHFLFSFAILSASVMAQNVPVPYSEDFENGARGWYARDDKKGSAWELGIPVFGFTQAAHSGSSCWDVNLNTGYTNNASCALYSPTFDFSTTSHATISFWLNYHVEYLWDYLTVEYSIDNGNTWLFLPFPFLIDPTGTTNGWTQSTLSVDDLAGFNAVQFRLVFISDGVITYDGYSMDDFIIEADALGTNDATNESLFSVYPNPGKGDITISFSNLKQNFSLKIFDANGKIIACKSEIVSGEDHITISNLVDGIYFATLYTPDQFETRKIFVATK